MKQSTVRRWLAFLLSAVLLASLLPALSLTAGARDPQKVNASTADELKTYLESSTDYDITLTKSIDKYIDSTDVWCTVRGNKRLNVNGFDVLVHQDGGKTVSYLFRVPADANLTVYDGKTTGTTAKIHYHAEILSGNLVGTIAYWRHLFDVYGKLTINNVMCTAGRVSTRWNFSKAQNVSVQTYGSAAIVHGGGYLEVNGAYLSGHTYIPELHDTPVVKVENNARVYFNFGEVHGHGSADCFGIANSATVQVASGIFDSDYYSKVMWGLESESNSVDFPGRVGLMKGHFSPNAIADTGETFTGSKLTVTAPKLSCGIAVYDGSSSESNGVTNLRVPGENPILRAWFSEPYFHTAVDDSPQAEHIYRVIWEIYDGLTFMAETVKFDDFDLNLMRDLPDFTPEQGKQYRVRCTIAEHLRQGITGAACWRYASMSSNYYVQVVEDMLAPVITRDLPSSTVFTPGQRLQLSIRASGDNLRYQWYALDPSRPTRPEAISGQTTATLTISNARETLDGGYIYCVVSNAAGSARTTYCKLAKDQTVIKEIPILNLDQPMHGVPLDTEIDIDIPGLRLVDSTWVKINPDSIEFVPLSDSDINDPIAGQSLALRLVVAQDNTVVVDNFASASALGHSVGFSEHSGNLYTFYFTSITVMADETMDIDLASLSFYGKDLEFGKKAPNLAERDCGFADLGFMALLDPDIRYSIHSKQWFVDGVETEEPTVEEDHTYTLKVRLQPEAGWKFTEDTTISVDGETLPVTLDTVSVGKERITYALFELEYATKGTADDERNVYDIWVGGVRVTDANRRDVLSDGGSVKYDPASNTLTLTNAGISGASIPIDPGTTSGILSDIDLTLELVGENTVTGMDARDGSYGILVRFSRNLVFTGSGTLDVASGSGRGNSAITATGITMLSGTIRASGTYASETSSCGVSCSDLILEGGTLTALGGEYPNSRGISGIVKVNRGTVTAIGEMSALNAAPSLPSGGSIVMVSTEPSADNAKAWNGADPLGGDGSSFKYVKIAPTNPFVDVKEGAYYYDAVQWAVNHDPQITNGTDPTHFSPDKTCTRAQVVTFLWRAMGQPEPTSTVNPFTDVKADQYYYKAVLWAVEKNITNGVSPTAFGPDRGCTRAQVVTFLWRAEGQPEPTKADNPFTDVKADQYYYKAVLWAVEKDITKGTSADKFSPDATCTRGQIVTFLYRDMK